jgi:hypothetical protein
MTITLQNGPLVTGAFSNAADVGQSAFRNFLQNPLETVFKNYKIKPLSLHSMHHLPLTQNSIQLFTHLIHWT